uniref:Tyr recombinase domain-containing protein n=1 Tax=viral metagenome TaxID=1070528 RepID=A0A6C0AQ64_9ZZZZ
MKHFEHTDLSEFSKRNYDTRLNKWKEYLNKPLSAIIKDPKGSFDLLKQVKDLTHTEVTYHLYLNAIVSYMKHNPVKVDKKVREEWIKLARGNSEIVQEHYKDNKPSELQKDKVMSWKEICNVRDRLPDGIPKLLLSMYTLLEPERADYFECELIYRGQKATSANYINLSDSKLVITDFKTAKKYDKLEQDIPPELMRQIALSVTEQPRQYLFVNRFKKPFERPQYSNWANRILSDIFDKPMTLTIIRHAFCSQIDFNAPLRSLEAISKRMGHDVGTQKRYQWINEVIE